MSALNLVPNPGLIAVQAGIFLANLVVVKKLMIDPYLKLRDLRFAQTTGGQAEAERTLRACEAKAQDLNRQMQEAFDFAKGVRQRAKEQALEQQQELIAAAKVEAKAILEAMKGEIARSLVEERRKVPPLVEGLSQQVLTQVMHA